MEEDLILIANPEDRPVFSTLRKISLQLTPGVNVCTSKLDRYNCVELHINSSAWSSPANVMVPGNPPEHWRATAATIEERAAMAKSSFIVSSV